MTSHHFANKRTNAYIALLKDYLEKRKTEGLGVPQSSTRKGQVANAFISSETGVPARVLEMTRVHKVILDYVDKIGFSEQLPSKSIIYLNSQPIYTHQVENYLNLLKSEGRKVPEHPETLGKPYLERIASECGIPARALHPRTSARSRLNEGIAELGLQVYVNDPIWTKLSYKELLEEGARLRTAELVGKANANQQRYNTVHALRVWMRNLNLSDESFVGAELLGEFDQKLEQARSNIRSKTTKSKFSSEMRRWISIHKELLKQKGLPANFAVALEMAIERSGLNAQRVGELADGCIGIIDGWLRGASLPSKSSFPFVSRIEKTLKLELGTLTSLVPHRRSKRFRLSDYPEHTIINGVKIPLRRDEYLLSKLRPLLPDDFNGRSEAARQEMVDWLIANLIGPTSDWAFLNRELGRITYSLKQFPSVLEQEWQELSAFKCDPLTPPGMKRSIPWSPATNKMRRSDLERFFGALSLPNDAEDHRLRGMGLSPSLFTLAMFISPAILHWWILWKGKRRCDPHTPKRDYKYTHYEAVLLLIIGGLFNKETGWIRQRPDLADHLQVVPEFIDKKLIKRAKRDWSGVCDQAFDYYMHFAEEVERNAEIIRDPFELILPILEMEKPISALKTFAQNVLDDMPDVGTAPLQAARSMRDYMIVRLLGATALRSKNIVELTYRNDNKGELHKENDKWVIEISHHRFKNKYSGFFGSKKKKHNYKRVLMDNDGLYNRLEEYLNVYRPALLQRTKSDILLVVNASRPKFTTNKFHSKYRSLTMQYLAHNPYLNRGIPGVKPHGPHSVRDIVATHIIRETGSYELAAYALADSVQTVKEHYARFMPEHKLHLVDKIMVEAW
jgi:integrase